jgi:integrative and conjugative element protein (TIGR02256 family)
MQIKTLIEPNSKRLILIHPAALEVINKFRQVNHVDEEAGGVLIGKRRGEHFEITAATQPQALDTRSKYHFFRSPTGHQTTVSYHWKKSDGEENYIGEWHTHPENHPTPSSIDLKEWKRISQTNNNPLIVIIQGIQSSYYALLIKGYCYALQEYC